MQLLEELPNESIDQLDKLFTYYDHFEVESRYEITFKEFVLKVTSGNWDAYLAI